MILLVHLREPCYDFCPVHATIEGVSTKESPP
uniref:Uncharacterized protein n=1 Tax=Wuchereria bancrofti TaxID=6293 RepID=A0AAF5PH94_WUCBA